MLKTPIPQATAAIIKCLGLIIDCYYKNEKERVNLALPIKTY